MFTRMLLGDPKLAGPQGDVLLPYRVSQNLSRPMRGQWMVGVGAIRVFFGY